MRHDSKYSQSHLSAVRQRPDGSIVLGQQYNKDYYRKHHHRDNEDYNNNNNYYRYNKERYNNYGSHSNSDLNFQNGERGSSSSSSSSSSDNGGVASALSVTHESERQWEWFEEVLAKSNRNKETVSKIHCEYFGMLLFTFKYEYFPIWIFYIERNSRFIAMTQENFTILMMCMEMTWTLVWIPFKTFFLSLYWVKKSFILSFFWPTFLYKFLNKQWPFDVQTFFPSLSSLLNFLFLLFTQSPPSLSLTIFSLASELKSRRANLTKEA